MRVDGTQASISSLGPGHSADTFIDMLVYLKKTREQALIAMGVASLVVLGLGWQALS